MRVVVVLQERTTDVKQQAVTGPDGYFTEGMPPGVYDLGLNNDSAPTTATCFYGPIGLTAGRVVTGL